MEEGPLHPFDFEACQLPRLSVEQLLGIDGSFAGVQPTANFFHERLHFNGEAALFEIDVDGDEVSGTAQRGPMLSWKEEKANVPIPVNRKLNSLLTSITTSDILRSASGAFSQESELERSSTPEIDARDDKRKVTDKWGFVVEDPSEATTNSSRGSSRAQNKLEEKWLDILRDWNSYSEEKKRRICKKFVFPRPGSSC